MKKLKNIFTTLALTSSLFFTGCYNAVFYEIHQDVESEDATVSGTINQITRYTLQDSNKTEYLVCNADGGLRYKLASDRDHGSWSTYGHLPFSLHSYDYYATQHNGEQIIQVLADSTNLYVLTCVYFDDNDEGTVAPKYIKLWTATITDWNKSKSSDWNCIDISTSETKNQIFKVYKNSTSGYYYSAFCIFSTNSINPENRKVYVRSGKAGAYYATKSKISQTEIQTPVYYEITPSGPNLKDDITTVWNGGSQTSLTEKLNICSASYFSNQINFFTSPAVATDEFYELLSPYKDNDDEYLFYENLVKNEDDKIEYHEPKCVYWGSGSTLYYYLTEMATTSADGSIGVSNNISALAVCADSILIGMGNTSAYSSSTSGGITHSYLSAGVPKGTSDFKTNASSQISSGYIVFSLLNANPAETETSSALYASIGFCGTGSSTAVSYSSVGLWSYYPSRGNWNRE